MFPATIRRKFPESAKETGRSPSYWRGKVDLANEAELVERARLGDRAAAGLLVRRHEGAVYAVVGSSSKNSGGLGAHPVMAVGVNFEGSLLVDVNGPQLDGYWIDKNGILEDHFRIVKGPRQVPAVPGWGRRATALALALVGLAALRRAAG